MEYQKIYNTCSIITTPYLDQNPGTSGLRKKVTHFRQNNYIENFVQSIFDAHKKEEFENKSLVVGGDGRFYNDVAINVIIKISAANGISKFILAENGIMSTPAVSLLVRNQPTDECFGAIILTASHNPGGEKEDLGIKFNNSAGAPAPEGVTARMFKCSKEISEYKTISFDGEFSLKENSKFQVVHNKNSIKEVSIEIESTTRLYTETMKKLFDFDKLHSLFKRNDFRFAFDAMHGASGPYALEIFHNILGVDLENLYDCDTLQDFGGLHPDPNLVYAKNLVHIMDINGKINEEGKVPDFGAACDGDADRNMILGKRFFISPSDSIAIIAANYKLIPNLNREGGLKGVARSMPTSGALDRVAKKLGIDNLKDGNRGYIFEYTDPVDHSISKNQGWIYSFKDGSRIIFRVSGTSSSGATIRIYFEKHVEPDGPLEEDVLSTIKSSDNNLVELALTMSKINSITNRSGPTVIT